MLLFVVTLHSGEGEEEEAGSESPKVHDVISIFLVAS